jgi:hypothetical protein
MEPPSTVQFVRLLRRYNLTRLGHLEDPFVKDLIWDSLEEDTRVALLRYSRGLYDVARHYHSFDFFKRPISVDELNGERLKNHPHFNSAFQVVLDDLQCLQGIRLMRPSQLKQVEFHGGTAAGYGYKGKKRDNHKRAVRNALRALRGYKTHGIKYRFVPDMAFARTQLSERSSPKLRHVWGRAFHHILIEGLLANPIYNVLKIRPSPIYIGRDLLKEMPFEIHIALRHREPVYCLDFSKFDASLSRFLISKAWSVLEHLVHFVDNQDRSCFSFMRDLFMNNPIVMPDGKLFIVRAGLPSGSYFTQILGSICNLLLIRTFQITHFGRPLPTRVLGDDSIFTAPVEMSIEDVASFFEPFGLKLNKEKTLITSEFQKVHFLGHNFYGSKVTRPVFESLTLSLYPEDPVPSAAASIVRVSSLLADSGFNCFLLFNLLQRMLYKHNVNWRDVSNRPVSFVYPFNKLFLLT